MEILTKDDFNKEMGIYKIINGINGKVYIGSSTQLKTRINNHIKNLKENKHHNKGLQKDYNIFGEENFKFDLLETLTEKSKLPIREKFYIEEYKKINGVYNVSDPTEEFWQKRTDTEIIKNKHVNDEQRKTINKGYIFGWLDCKFTNDLKKINAKLEKDLFIEKSKIDNYIRNKIDNVEIDITEFHLNEWYNTNDIFILQMPYYKKEFREIYNIIFESETIILVNEETYKKVIENRINQIIEYKNSKRNKSTDKVYSLKGSKPKKESSKSKYRSTRGKIINIFETKFEYLFDELKNKLSNCESVSLNKLSRFLFEEISNNIEIDSESFDKILKNFLRKNIVASIFNFSSETYQNETLEKFGIKEREVKIISRDLATEVSEYNRTLESTIRNKEGI